MRDDILICLRIFIDFGLGAANFWLAYKNIHEPIAIFSTAAGMFCCAMGLKLLLSELS